MDCLLVLLIMPSLDCLVDCFFYILIRAIMFSPAIMHALTTDGVYPVICIKMIRNIMLITLILRFERFIFESNIVMPIINIPHVCA